MVVRRHVRRLAGVLGVGSAASLGAGIWLYAPRPDAGEPPTIAAYLRGPQRQPDAPGGTATMDYSLAAAHRVLIGSNSGGTVVGSLGLDAVIADRAA